MNAAHPTTSADPLPHVSKQTAIRLLATLVLLLFLRQLDWLIPKEGISLAALGSYPHETVLSIGALAGFTLLWAGATAASYTRLLGAALAGVERFSQRPASRLLTLAAIVGVLTAYGHWAGTGCLPGDVPVPEPVVAPLGAALTALVLLAPFASGEEREQGRTAPRGNALLLVTALLSLALLLGVWIRLVPHLEKLAANGSRPFVLLLVFHLIVLAGWGWLTMRLFWPDDGGAPKQRMFDGVTLAQRTGLLAASVASAAGYWVVTTAFWAEAPVLAVVAPLGPVITVCFLLAALGEGTPSAPRFYAGLGRQDALRVLTAASLIVALYAAGLLVRQTAGPVVGYLLDGGPVSEIMTGAIVEPHMLWLMACYAVLALGLMPVTALALERGERRGGMAGLRGPVAAVAVVAALTACLGYWAAVNLPPFQHMLGLKLVPLLPLLALAAGWDRAQASIWPGLDRLGSHATRWAAGATALAAWALLWFAPWQSLLTPWPWLRLLVAATMFVSVGLLLFLVIQRGQSVELVDGITVGFVLSIAVTGVVATVARLTHLPFQFIKAALFGAGAVLIVLALPGGQRPAVVRAAPWRGDAAAEFTAAVAALAIMLAALTTPGRWNSDNYTNLAYLTTWQHTPYLDFRDIYFDLGHVDSQRFWLSYVIMAQAIIADSSGLHGVLILSTFLPPVLAILSMLGVYGLARAAGLSPRLSWLAVIVQACALLLLAAENQPGAVFIERLSQDKTIAAFLVAPVFLRAAAGFLCTPGARTYSIFALAAIGMMFSHPTALGVAALAAVGYGLLELLISHKARAFALLAGTLLVVGAIPFSFRYVEAPFKDRLEDVGYFSVREAEAAGYLAERSDHVSRLFILPDNRFYGFTLFLLEPEAPVELGPRGTLAARHLARWGALLLLAITGLLALWNFRASMLARLVLAATAVLLLGAVPFTGWIIGRFIGAFQLWRIPWQYPFGITLVFTGTTLGRAVQGGSSPLRLGVKLRGAVWVSCLALLFLLGAALGAIPKRLPEPGHLAFYNDLACLGSRLDDLLAGPTYVLGDEQTNHYLRGLSPNARAVAIKSRDEMERHGLAPALAAQRWADWQMMTSATTPSAERLRLMRKYGVQYVSLLPEHQALLTAHLHDAGSVIPVVHCGSISLFRVAPGSGY